MSCWSQRAFQRLRQYTSNPRSAPYLRERDGVHEPLLGQDSEARSSLSVMTWKRNSSIWLCDFVGWRHD